MSSWKSRIRQPEPVTSNPSAWTNHPEPVYMEMCPHPAWQEWYYLGSHFQGQHQTQTSKTVNARFSILFMVKLGHELRIKNQGVNWINSPEYGDSRLVHLLWKGSESFQIAQWQMSWFPLSGIIPDLFGLKFLAKIAWWKAEHTEMTPIPHWKRSPTNPHVSISSLRITISPKGWREMYGNSAKYDKCMTSRYGSIDHRNHAIGSV